MTIDKQDIKIVVAAISAAAAAFGGVQQFDQRGPTQAQVQQMIDQSAASTPYGKDKAYIYSQLTNNRIQLVQIQSDLSSLRVSEARVETKIDLLLRRKGTP